MFANPLSCSPFLLHFGAMSDQDQQSRRQDNQQEPQQHDRRVVVPPQVQAFIRVADAFLQLIRIVMMHRAATRTPRIPYHTSALSREAWVQELLTGHPERIRTELGVYRSTFTLLIKAMQKLELYSSRHVSIEEQVSIFLYTAVTGLSSTHVGERFQRSSSTIAKYVLQ